MSVNPKIKLGSKWGTGARSKMFPFLVVKVPKWS